MVETKQNPPCGEHDVKISRLEQDTEKQWRAIEQLQRRPPVWATAVISLLTFLLGSALTYAGLVTRIIK